MNINLPVWKPEYEPRVTEGAYNKLLAKAEPLLARCLQLYEAYLKTGNEVLYEVFGEVCLGLYTKLYRLSYGCQEFDRISKQLATAAEVVSGADELPYKATMLWDLAAVVRGS